MHGPINIRFPILNLQIRK